MTSTQSWFYYTGTGSSDKTIFDNRELHEVLTDALGKISISPDDPKGLAEFSGACGPYERKEEAIEEMQDASTVPYEEVDQSDLCWTVMYGKIVAATAYQSGQTGETVYDVHHLHTFRRVVNREFGVSNPTPIISLGVQKAAELLERCGVAEKRLSGFFIV